MGDPEVFTADFYNHRIYPGDREAAQAIKRDVGILPSTTTDQYLMKMAVLEKDLDSFQPEFVIYNAGTDILQGDPLGNLSITPEGII